MVKFKYFKTLAVYNNNSSTIANDDIVFIEDNGSLVTHGKTYKFSTPTPVVVSSASAGTAVSVTIDPNKTYSFPLVSSLTITLGALVDSSNYINEYHFEFNSGSTATTLSLPNTVKGIDASSIEANTHYEVSIKYYPKDTNYYGIIHSWELS